MITNRFLAAAISVSLIAFPAMAQTSAGSENNGHHYSGGPKTEVPHHMGKKETVGMSTTSVDKSTTSKRTGGHHYQGGPNTSVPHHMGDKQ
jgi:hypothetical protein